MVSRVREHEIGSAELFEDSLDLVAVNIGVFCRSPREPMRWSVWDSSGELASEKLDFALGNVSSACSCGSGLICESGDSCTLGLVRSSKQSREVGILLL